MVKYKCTLDIRLRDGMTFIANICSNIFVRASTLAFIDRFKNSFLALKIKAVTTTVK
jgi:hypothetical protein